MKSLPAVACAAMVAVSGCATGGGSGASREGARSAAPAGLDTLFLTWAEDPTSTMIVQWIEPGIVPPLAEGEVEELPAGVPTLEGITMDGDSSDWGDRGFEAQLLADAEGRAPMPGDLGATVRLGMDERGLLVLVEVQDDAAVESKKADALWEGDGVELFVSAADGSRAYQVVIAPGGLPEQAIIRTQVVDRRGDAGAGTPIATIANAVRGTRGYSVEARLPWEAIGATAGAAARLQVYVNDSDPDEPRRKLVWFPAEDTHEDARSSRTVTPATAESTVARERARGWLTRVDDEVVAEVRTVPSLAGRKVRVVSAGDAQRVLGTAELRERDGLAVATLPVKPPKGARLGEQRIVLDGEAIGTVPATKEVWAKAPRPTKIAYGAIDTSGEVDRLLTVGTTVRPFGPSTYSVQRAKLDDLRPDTEYAFVVRGSGEEFRFRTAPKALEPRRPLVFAEGGDIGTGPVVPPLHRMAASWDPLFGLVGGDLAYADGRNVKREIEYLRLWHEHMRAPGSGDGEAARLIPMLVTIGNHEVQSGGFSFDDRTKAPFFYSLFADAFPIERGSYGTLDFGDYLSLIYLDTHTTPVADQSSFLREALAERKDMPHVFPLYHVPAYPSVRKIDDGKRGEARRAMYAEWIPLFDVAGVRVVFEHDDHAYKRTHPLRGGEPAEGGTVYLGDGSWGRDPRPVDPTRPYLANAQQAYNVIKVTLDGAAARFEAFDEKGAKLDEHAYEARVTPE